MQHLTQYYGESQTGKQQKSIDKNKVSSENGDTPLFHIYVAFFFFRSPLGLEVGLRFTPLRKQVVS